MAQDAPHVTILCCIAQIRTVQGNNFPMADSEAQTNGFGTTSIEWETLRLAYTIAVEVSMGHVPPEELVARFRGLDQTGNLMFESWWNSRPEF